MRRTPALKQVINQQRASRQRARRIRKRATGLRVNRQRRFGSGDWRV